MVSLLVEVQSPTHGFERFNLKIIKKYNINFGEIKIRDSTRPIHNISGIEIGRNISKEEAQYYLLISLEVEGYRVLKSRFLG